MKCISKYLVRLSPSPEENNALRQSKASNSSYSLPLALSLDASFHTSELISITNYTLVHSASVISQRKKIKFPEMPSFLKIASYHISVCCSNHLTKYPSLVHLNGTERSAIFRSLSSLGKKGLNTSPRYDCT